MTLFWSRPRLRKQEGNIEKKRKRGEKKEEKIKREKNKKRENKEEEKNYVDTKKFPCDNC